MMVRVPTRSLPFATLLLVPALAMAQPPGPPPDGGPPDGPPPRQGRPGGFRGGMMGGGPAPLMEALDKDRDGSLSALEVRCAPESLRALDRNGDGQIDRSEMRPGMAGRGGRGGPGRPGVDGFGPPPGGPGGPGPRRRGGPGGPEGPGGPDGMGRRPEVGDVLPPFVRRDLNLDREQRRKLEALEAEVRSKLQSILTREQMSQCEEALRRGPGGGPGGGPPDDDRPPVRPGRPD